jgi:hypothetical protein
MNNRQHKTMISKKENKWGKPHNPWPGGTLRNTAQEGRAQEAPGCVTELRGMGSEFEETEETRIYGGREPQKRETCKGLHVA